MDKGRGKHAATLTMGSPGVLHGSFSYLIQDEEGQVVNPHSISAGLDYPGIGPEHSFLKDTKRAEYFAVTDDEALEAFQVSDRSAWTRGRGLEALPSRQASAEAF